MKKLHVAAGSLLILSAFLFFSGCQQNAPSPTPSTPAENQTAPTTGQAEVTINQNSSAAAVNIQNMAFDKNNVTVSVGGTVTWTNRDSVPHTVTSDTGLFDNGNLANGQSFSFTFSKEGNYTYHCSIHPSMTATVIVKS